MVGLRQARKGCFCLVALRSTGTATTEQRTSMDLTNVTFAAISDSLVATFIWTGQVPRRDAVLWQIKLTSGDRETIRYLGYKIVDGKHSAQFVYDFGGAWQANPTPAVE